MTPTVHDWSTWVDPRMPVVGPPMPWPAIDTAVPHYTAAVNLPDGDLGEFVYHIPPYLRAIQRDYTVNRGYSIGYSWAVDWLGGIWKLRGWDIKCAANKGHNDHCFAILCLVDGADPVTPEAAASIRWLVAEGQKRAGRTLKIVDHGRLAVPPGTPTACAGSGIRKQVDAGVFKPTPTPPEDDVNPVKYRRVYVPNGPEAHLTIRVKGYATAHERDVVAAFDEADPVPVTAEQYAALLAVYNA